MLDPEADTAEGKASSRDSIPDSGGVVVCFAGETAEGTPAAVVALDGARQRTGGMGGAAGRGVLPSPFLAAALG